MRPHYDLIGITALRYAGVGQTLTAAWLAKYLNLKGLLTSAGRQYDPNGRGIYRTLGCAYRALQTLRPLEAKAVADVFTKADGTHAWA